MRVVLEHDPAALQVLKRPLSVAVEFAKPSGIVDSLEGPVHYLVGDALLTGVEGERWVIQKHKFEQSYTPVEPTINGKDGFYIKKPMHVWAKRLTENISVAVGWQNDPLTGVSGDWLLQYGSDDFGIIQHDIFIKTYDILTAKKPS